jgi:hypothetical protein
VVAAGRTLPLQQDAVGRERTRNVRLSRTLAVTPGHSKTDADQARCPLTRSDEIAPAAVRFPPGPRKVPSTRGNSVGGRNNRSGVSSQADQAFDPRSVDSPRAIATVEHGIRTDDIEQAAGRRLRDRPDLPRDSLSPQACGACRQAGVTRASRCLRCHRRGCERRRGCR